MKVKNTAISIIEFTTLIIIDIDECATNNGGCLQICTNTNTSFVCSCDTRHILAADNFTCEGKLLDCKSVQSAFSKKVIRTETIIELLGCTPGNSMAW